MSQTEKVYHSNKKLRYAIMCNGNYLLAWQAQCIQELSKLDFVEPVLLIVNNNSTTAKPNLLSKIIKYPYSIFLYRLQKRLIKISGQKTVELPTPINNLTKINCTVTTKGKHSEYFSSNDIEHIKSFNLDFIIRFGFNIIRGEILSAAKYGIWSYHHGDEKKYRGGPPCFWELYKNEKSVGSILQKLTDKLDGGIILKKGRFGAVPHSYKDTIENIYSLSAYWIKQVCIDIQNSNASYIDSEPSTTTAPVYKFPTNGIMLLYGLKKTGRKIRFHFNDLFKPETWKVGVIKNESEKAGQFDKSQKITWYENPVKSGYYADPFLTEQNKVNYLLVENYDYKTEKGKITCINLSNNETSVLIEEDYHLSYPFSFNHQNKTYVLPEASASGKLTLYEVNLADSTILNKHVILEDIHAFDPTLIEYNSKWWLFVSQKNTHSNTCLHIYYAESPFGPFKAHCMNPVKTDITASRPAGGIFNIDGFYFRPSQNCEITYGGSIILNKLHILNEDTYLESFSEEVKPIENIRHNEGIHTINSVKGLVTIDVKRHTFNGAHFFKQLARKLRLKS